MNRNIPFKTAVITLAAGLIGVTTLVAFASTEHPQGERPPSFSEMDVDGDQRLSPDEVKGPLADDFDRFDQNQDGYLSEQEIPPPPGGEQRRQ